MAGHYRGAAETWPLLAKDVTQELRCFGRCVATRTCGGGADVAAGLLIPKVVFWPRTDERVSALSCCQVTL